MGRHRAAAWRSAAALMDSPALQALIDQPTPATRALLFAHLANRVAAVRAKAADGLLKLYATQRHRAGLARDFGSEPEAILLRCLDELRALIDEPRSEAWTRFVASLEMNLDAWRDGTGYDLAALREMPDIERGAIREMIAARLGNQNRAADWRDIEAATALGLTESLALRADDADPQTRLRAKVALGDSAAVIDQLCETIASSTDAHAVSKALDHVSNYPSEAVKQAVITRVRKVDAQFIYASMVLLAVFGGVEDAFAERPFLFQVQEQGRDGELMRQLLGRVTNRTA
jgi:hypothetical protein